MKYIDGFRNGDAGRYLIERIKKNSKILQQMSKKLRTVLDSIKTATIDCGVKIATGDTKVVAKSQCDGIYINTAGIGQANPLFNLDTMLIKKDDVVAVNLISSPGSGKTYLLEKTLER